VVIRLDKFTLNNSVQNTCQTAINYLYLNRFSGVFVVSFLLVPISPPIKKCGDQAQHGDDINPAPDGPFNLPKPAAETER